LRQFGSFALATVGLNNVSIIVLTWENDQVFATEEKETISVLTLCAIILGAVNFNLIMNFTEFGFIIIYFDFEIYFF
jgi:hypothetical protein